MSKIDEIHAILEQSITVKQRLLEDEAILQSIAEVSGLLIDTFKAGGKVFFCGNGGSAADAQHLAAELSGRFYFDRPPLFAEALNVNTAYLTAVANDYGFEWVFARILEAKARKGDVLIALSTSGNSPNIIKALEFAKTANVITVGMTGKTGGKMKMLCKHLLRVPSTDTPRIQECHITIGHIICELAETGLFLPRG